MIRQLKILFFLMLWGTAALGQYGFQKVYDHHELDTISIISDVYVQDDSIYFSGGGRRGNAAGLRFGQVNDSGELFDLTRYDIPDHQQRAYFSDVDIDTNFRGNLVNVYSSRDNNFNERGFRLIEYSLQGEIVFDSLYTFLWEQDSIGIFDHSKLVHLNDSSYLINLNYNVLSESSTNAGLSGTIILKINASGEILWEKRYYDSSNNERSQWMGIDLKYNSADDLFLHVIEFKRYAPSSYEKNWAKHRFIKLNKNGTILSQKIFQEGQYCFALTGNSYFDNDTIYLQYFDSKIFGESDNNDYFLVRPILAKIDPDMNIVWKKELQERWNYVTYFRSIQRIRKVSNTSFVAARGHSFLAHGSSEDNSAVGGVNVRFYNFTSKGNFNWIRDYHYYPIDTIPNQNAVYEINDIELMSDGGFVLGGQVLNRKFTSQNKPGQFAYLLRTNCLGFLSPPEAQFSYESNKNEVFFTNNSINAGSYTWAFGDGDTLRTGEKVDSVAHTYTYEGQYDVTLIAHGCNGAADTVTLQVDVEEGAYGNIGDNFFSIYPNPVSSGGLITVETGNIENAALQFYTAQGQRAKTVPLPKAATIYFIEHRFAAGTYTLQLVQEGEIVQRKKLVVQ
ncbi:MAG: PKD domain-containing protein [Bacteroidota bacterium]